jgi:hypothetical protein
MRLLCKSESSWSSQQSGQEKERCFNGRIEYSQVENSFIFVTMDIYIECLCCCLKTRKVGLEDIRKPQNPKFSHHVLGYC